MHELSVLLAVVASAACGGGVGFVAGLVPGLHMNNIAAAMTAYGSAVLGAFALLDPAGSGDRAGLLASCFISAAVVSHIFSECVVSTYVGIPDEDVVSVLPAHKLAKAGLGFLAIRSSADGAMMGVLLGSALLFPVCALMSSPVCAYDAISALMPFIVSAFIAVLVLSEGCPSLRFRRVTLAQVQRMATALAIFLAAGVLGTAVLLTDYYAARVPDFPWVQGGFVPKSSLLLPMFAGLFGVPSLLLSMGSRPLGGMLLAHRSGHMPGPTLRQGVTAVMGGVLVGWLPGMTSGSAATICSPRMADDRAVGDVSSATSFVWLYSAISACGAVMAVGALFAIQRARSGSMDAVSLFVGSAIDGQAWQASVPVMAPIIMAMLASSLISHWALCRFMPALSRSSGLLCSRGLAWCCLAFVTVLCLLLTGVRGAVVMASAASLGLLPPLVGVRRLQLMGSLLVPIWILFVQMM